MRNASVSRFVVGLVLVAQTGYSAGIRKFKVDSAKSPVVFDAVGKPGFLKIQGTGAQLAGEAQIENGSLKGNFTVGMAAITTNNSMRDGHMHEKYLDSKKFAEASLEVSELKIPENAPSYNGEFKGKLRIKDNTKDITGKINLAFADKSASGDASFEVSLEDFPSIGVPSWLGITVAKTVTLNVKIQAQEEPMTAPVANVEAPKKEATVATKEDKKSAPIKAKK